MSHQRFSAARPGTRLLPGRSTAGRPLGVPLPAAVSAFRLPSPGGDPAWFGDDTGGSVDPDDPRLTRRDFLLRVAVAAGAATVGGAINVLTTALARHSPDVSASPLPAAGRR